MVVFINITSVNNNNNIHGGQKKQQQQWTKKSPNTQIDSINLKKKKSTIKLI